MERFRFRPSPGTAFGVLALVVALAGTALADPVVKVSVLNKKEKKQTRKIAAGQVKKLAPKLAVANAANAANADKLGGQAAGAFARANELHNPARFVINDATAGDGAYTQVTLLQVNGFTIRAQCADNLSGSGTDSVEVTVAAEGNDDSSFSGGTSMGGTLDTSGAASQDVVAFNSNSNVVRSGYMVAVSPSGQVATVVASGEVADAAGDCLVGLSAIVS